MIWNGYLPFGHLWVKNDFLSQARRAEIIIDKQYSLQTTLKG